MPRRWVLAVGDRRLTYGASHPPGGLWPRRVALPEAGRRLHDGRYDHAGDDLRVRVVGVQTRQARRARLRPGRYLVGQEPVRRKVAESTHYGPFPRGANGVSQASWVAYQAFSR